MNHHVFMRKGIAVLSALIALSSTALAWAVSPTVIWQTSGAGGGIYSGDGSSILLTTSTGFQMRRSSDGVLQNTITLPAGSVGYDAKAFSPDKQYVATTTRANGVTRIDIWRVSNGTLFRTINTAAVRNNKSLDFSSAGFIQGFERFAYGGGGYLRVFRVSDGALIATLGPYAQNSTPRAKYSPNGSYLTFTDQIAHLIKIARTTDWATVYSVGNGAGMLQWAPDSATYWTSGNSWFPQPYQQVRVPAGTIAKSVQLVDGHYPSGVTPDGRFFLGDTLTRDTLEIIRTSDGGVQLSYSVPVTTYAGPISPTGTQFTYDVCPTNGNPCTCYVASMPAL